MGVQACLDGINPVLVVVSCRERGQSVIKSSCFRTEAADCFLSGDTVSSSSSSSSSKSSWSSSSSSSNSNNRDSRTDYEDNNGSTPQQPVLLLSFWCWKRGACDCALSADRQSVHDAGTLCFTTSRSC